jgi:hypothetical protein
MSSARAEAPKLGEMTMAFSVVRLAIVAIVLSLVGVVYASYPVARDVAGSLYPRASKPVPRLGAGPSLATLTSAQGTVRVRPADKPEFVVADAGMRLYQGDTIQTAKNGMAKLNLSDGSDYVVRADTLVVMQKMQ